MRKLSPRTNIMHEMEENNPQPLVQSSSNRNPKLENPLEIESHII
jgi:hypothetical protein